MCFHRNAWRMVATMRWASASLTMGPLVGVERLTDIFHFFAGLTHVCQA